MKYQTEEAFAQANMFGLGQFNQAYAQYFTGKSFLNPLTKPGDAIPLVNVTFEPGCRKLNPKYSLSIACIQ